jgi:DNA-binding transcriptional ArsR family regulator
MNTKTKALKWPDLKQSCETTAKTLKALAHPHRLQLLCHLTSGEKTVGELESLCGASQSLVSQFLGRMKSEGLVASDKEGLFVKYRIADPRILKTLQALQRIYCDE